MANLHADEFEPHHVINNTRNINVPLNVKSGATNVLEDVEPVAAKVHTGVLNSGPVPGEVEPGLLADL